MSVVMFLYYVKKREVGDSSECFVIPGGSNFASDDRAARRTLWSLCTPGAWCQVQVAAQLGSVDGIFVRTSELIA